MGRTACKYQVWNRAAPVTADECVFDRQALAKALKQTVDRSSDVQSHAKDVCPSRMATRLNLAMLFGLVLFALAPMPEAFPKGVSTPLGTVYLPEIFGVTGTLLCVGYVTKVWRNGTQWILVFLAAIVLFTLVGVLNGGELGAAFRDVRGPLIFVCVIVMVLFSLRFDQANLLRLGPRAVKLIVLWSAVAAILGVAGLGGWISGRFTAASLYGLGSSGESDLSRQLLSSGRMLVAVLCFYIIYFCRRPAARVGFGNYAVLISCSVALLLTFSRNHLVTVIAALVVATIFAARYTSAILCGTKLVAVSSGSITLAGVLVATLSERFNSLIENVSATFRTRVVEGLDPSVINVESSAEWRDTELQMAMSSIASRFWLGTGFGSPYRSYAIGEVFSGSYGLTYIHNSFLWIPVKIGMPLALLILVMWIGLFVRVWSKTQVNRESIGRDAILVLLALCPAMYVAPTLFSTEGAPVLGGLVAIAVYAAKFPYFGLSGPPGERGISHILLTDKTSARDKRGAIGYRDGTEVIGRAGTA
ncbi:O-antigen ligase family protein [Rhodococcus sp. NPDC057529]|uniref:O-antigen ligase family protein n=1 Tax=Rhodococcus sp. NPDC057529 TaxID=3346158 RepID=UPI003671037A